MVFSTAISPTSPASDPGFRRADLDRGERDAERQQVTEQEESVDPRRAAASESEGSESHRRERDERGAELLRKLRGGRDEDAFDRIDARRERVRDALREALVDDVERDAPRVEPERDSSAAGVRESRVERPGDFRPTVRAEGDGAEQGRVDDERGRDEDRPAIDDRRAGAEAAVHIQRMLDARRSDGAGFEEQVRDARKASEVLVRATEARDQSLRELREIGEDKERRSEERQEVQERIARKMFRHVLGELHDVTRKSVLSETA